MKTTMTHTKAQEGYRQLMTIAAAVGLMAALGGCGGDDSSLPGESREAAKNPTEESQSLTVALVGHVEGLYGDPMGFVRVEIRGPDLPVTVRFTDEEGNFQVDGLLPDQEYRLEVISRQTAQQFTVDTPDDQDVLEMTFRVDW